MVLVSLLFFVITNWIIMPVRIVGDSMYPTLENKQVGLTFVLSKHFGLDRFDIIVVEEHNELIIKRIIGLPNETVEYKNNTLYINDKPLAESFLQTNYRRNVEARTKLPFTYRFAKVQLGQDEYFVMGDNRPRSQDSRFFGPLHKSEIISKGFLGLYQEE